MTPSFHTGHAYVAFDRVIRAIDDGLRDRTPALAGCTRAAVKARLMQRIVEIALWPYVGACGRRFQSGEPPLPPPGVVIDYDGVILETAGTAGVTWRRVGSSLFEYAVHWLHLLGAILLGAINWSGRDRPPATLVLGVGNESLFYEGTDARFVAYCRNGPIAPLASARRLIVHCAAGSVVSSDPDFAYDRVPLAALIRDTRLGALTRAELLWSHLTSPFVFLRALLQLPLLVLLARDIAYTPAVRTLDRRITIDAVVVTNSLYHAQPLWMRSSSRRFRLHMVWYSQNTIPLVYANDDFASDLPNNRYMTADEMWVWTGGYKAYLEKFQVASDIHVVGPILWYLPETAAPCPEDEIRIALFDVTPLRDEAALRLGLVRNYYNAETMIRFMEDVLSVSRELSVRAGKPVRVLLKHKRSYNENHDPRYIELIKKIAAAGAVELVPFQFNIYALLATSALSIVIPYSSPAYVASHCGVQGIFFDTTRELAPTFERAPSVAFASGRDELLRMLLEAASLAPHAHVPFTSQQH